MGRAGEKTGIGLPISFSPRPLLLVRKYTAGPPRNVTGDTTDRTAGGLRVRRLGGIFAASDICPAIRPLRAALGGGPGYGDNTHITIAALLCE